MAAERVTFDLEFAFDDGDRLTFSTEQGRDSQTVLRESNSLRFELHHSDTLTEEIVIHVAKLKYSRFTKRVIPADE